MCVAGSATASPLVIAPATAQQMVAALVAGSAGITIVAGSEVYTGDAVASGTFTGGSGILPFNTGVILTSGSAAGAIGPNNNGGFTVDNSGGSDAQLSALSGQNTFDAAVLEFDFIPVAATVSFQYVFGSEEYNEFVGSFNDVFAFFLNGTNIALVPGTNTPVSVNNVNCGVNPQYYTDNGGGGAAPCGNAGLNTQYDGLAGANPLFALFALGNVNPGVSNHIKLAIADAGDPVLDSGVFLAGGSFINQPPPVAAVPEPTTLALLGAGLGGLATRVRRRRKA